MCFFRLTFSKTSEVCMQAYKLDPSHFYSAPNLSWDAMLIATGVKLELLQDIDQLFFENGIRGGINGLGAFRQFEANNKYLKTSIQTRNPLLALSLT